MKRAGWAPLLLAACSSVGVDLEAAESARGLPFKTRPLVVYDDRDAFIARTTAASSSSKALDEWERDLATLARIGFFPKSYSAEAATKTQVSVVGAYYTPSSDTVTVFAEPPEFVLVHELTHALQDQYFDLDAYDHGATTSDEKLARRAVTEGDATLAQIRFLYGGSPTRLASILLPSVARAQSDAVLDAAAQANVPPLFLAYAAFTYNFGTIHSAAAAGVYDDPPGFDWARANALFRERTPASTQEVLRHGRDVDPIVEVGLKRLPDSVADRYEIDEVDRLGEFFITVLLRGAAGLRATMEAWDGDQVVYLRRRDRGIPPAETLPSGLVWTSTWDDPGAASLFAQKLLSVHAGSLVGGDPHHHQASDGERFWIETRAERVVFVKNLDLDDMKTLAAAALGLPPPPDLPALVTRPTIRVRGL